MKYPKIKLITKDTEDVLEIEESRLAEVNNVSVGSFSCARLHGDLKYKALVVSETVTPYIITDYDGETCIIFVKN
jgi:hypothetical protein